MLNKKDVTIIIPHYDTEKANTALHECLTSLFESEFPKENIIVALNGDPVGFGPLSGLETRCLYIPEQGQCKAVNAAVAISSTPWIMVTNNDMIYPPNWFETFLGFMANSDVEARPFTLSPILIEPNDGAPTFKKYFCGGAGGDFDKKKFLEYAKETSSDLAELRPGFNLPFFMKREIWDVVGGYDVKYDPWSSNSDSDFEYKLKLAGVDMLQNTSSPVYHFSQTSGTFEPKNQSYWQKNWGYFIEKWGFPRTDEGIWQGTFEIPYGQLKYHPFFEGVYSRRDA
jgi:GT2 family glycosyltransferase